MIRLALGSLENFFYISERMHRTLFLYHNQDNLI